MRFATFLACVGACVQIVSAVDFPAAVDGVVTLTTAGEYSAAVPTSDKLVVNVGGEAKLTSNTGYKGEVVVKSGSTLNVTQRGLLANAPITVESGGTLKPTFAGSGQWVKVFLQPIRIAGSGNGGIGAFKFAGTTNGSSTDSIVKTLVLTDDATIDCSVRWGVSNGEGDGTIDLAGHTLKRIGGSNFMIVSALVTPGTFENTAGTITFQNNNGPFKVKDGCKGEDTIFKMTGGTISFWNTTGYVPYKVIMNSGAISAGSGGGLPPKNSFSGPVEVNFWLNVTPDAAKSLGFMGPLMIAKPNPEKDNALTLNSEGTMYVGGPVSGAGHLRACNGGLVVVTNAADAGTVRFVSNCGRFELDVGHVNAGMFRCANGGNVYGVFRHKRGILDFSLWDNPRIGESPNSFGAYVFESGEMHPSNSVYLAKDNSFARAMFLQKGGHFKLEGDPNSDSHKGRLVYAGASNADVSFVQTGGTNDTLYGRLAVNSIDRFSLGAYGGTNFVFALSGSNTVFRTDRFLYACTTNVTKAVIAVNDGASFKARRFCCPTTRAEGTEVTLSVNGGVIFPLFHYGWSDLSSDNAAFLTRTPEHVIVGEKGVVFDTSECLSDKGAAGPSVVPLTLKGPEGQGIASIALPSGASSATYYGPVPVVIVGPAGSYGASAYADYDFATKKLSKIVVTSAGCNYDETTKIYLRTYKGAIGLACTDFTLTGAQKSGPLVKRGSNALSLYGPNTYQGGTVVEQGELRLYNGSFPTDTPLTVCKGATLNAYTTAIRVSRLAGQGALKAGGTTVTEALVIDADQAFAAGATPLTADGSVTFAQGAKVEIAMTDEQKAAYRDRKSVTVLKTSQAGGLVGSPTLLVNGQADPQWRVKNTGTELKVGFLRGSVILLL